MFLLPNSEWEQLSHKLNQRYRPDELGFGPESVTYPIAMPLKAATVRFNFRTSYNRQFQVPGDNSMLPREFYRVPAHKQYKVWPKKLGEVCNICSHLELFNLYKLIGMENWCEVRLNPQFLGQGWGQACVPSAAQCTCCGAPMGLPAEAFEVSDVTLAPESRRMAVPVAGGIITLAIMGVLISRRFGRQSSLMEVQDQELLD